MGLLVRGPRVWGHTDSKRIAEPVGPGQACQCTAKHALGKGRGRGLVQVVVEDEEWGGEGALILQGPGMPANIKSSRVIFNLQEYTALRFTNQPNIFNIQKKGAAI